MLLKVARTHNMAKLPSRANPSDAGAHLTQAQMFFIVQQKMYLLNCNRVNPLYFQQD
jgi:hypothetical protein